MAIHGNGTTTEAFVRNVALIFGVTGLVGKELARILAAKPGWKVYGIARRSDDLHIPASNYQFISCDLLDPLQTLEKLSFLLDVTHLYWITWSNQFPLDTLECCEQNKAMMSNALNAILPKAKALKHISLQTGAKHYISLNGPFNNNPIRYTEDSPRVEGQNFYYTLEDLLIEKLNGKVAWSVHRPGLLIGNSHRTFYNFIGGLCVYATICRYLNLPFLFGGSKECWEDMYIDSSDARLVAEQHIWASTNEGVSSMKGQAFNATNGTPSFFTWKEIWPEIGAKFGVEVSGDLFLLDFRFSDFMADKGNVWEEIVEKEGLLRTKIEDLGNWQFMDGLFRCSNKMLLSRDKVNRFGFMMSYKTLDSILYWIDCMRQERLIPAKLDRLH